MSAEGFKEQDPTFATRAIHDAQDPEQWDAMPVVLPISLATTFKQDAPAQFRVNISSCLLTTALLQPWEIFFLEL